MRYEQQSPCELTLVVVAGDGPSLFGRNWLRQIQLDWKTIRSISRGNNTQQHLERLLTTYEFFTDDLGTIKTIQAQLAVPEQAQPHFCKPRSVPFALKPAIEQELDRLEKAGVLERLLTAVGPHPLYGCPNRMERSGSAAITKSR